MKYHVIPIGDLKEHDCSEECWCEPFEDDEEPNVIVHNALDDREGYEQGIRKVN